MHQWSREDLAWAAGFLEGEGSFRVGRSTKNKRIYKVLDVSAVQVEREPLEKMLSIFPFGKIYGPYTHSGKGTRLPHYRFVANRFERAQAVIAAVWPWLSTKRKAQCKAALTEIIEHSKREQLKRGPKGVIHE